MANQILTKQALKVLYQDFKKPIGDNYDDWITTMATVGSEGNVFLGPQTVNSPAYIIADGTTNYNWSSTFTTVYENSAEWSHNRFDAQFSAGTSTINSTIISSNWDSAYYNVTILSADGLNARAGTLMTTWANGQVVYASTVTTDIGSTSAVQLSAGFDTNGDVILQGIISEGTWQIKGTKELI